MSMDELMEAMESYEEDGEFKTNSKYKEIFKLEQMLLASNIPYTLRQHFDGWQIEYPADKQRVCSVIEHFGSYGHEDDLLEIMGLTQNEDCVEGYLSAEEVFNRISAHYKGCKTKQWTV